MPLVISIVGRSNSGKTTLLEKIIPELSQRGFALAAIKHTLHDFEMDYPGKDTWRLARAGSDTVVLGSPHKVALIRHAQDSTLDELLALTGEDHDLVLLEGFKQSRFPKVEVHRKGFGDLVCKGPALVAVVSDEPVEADVPQFSPDQVGPLVDLMLEKAVQWPGEESVTVSIEGHTVPLNEMQQAAVRKAVLGSLPGPDSSKKFEQLHITLRRGKG